jgi:hypothetical protein
VVLRSSDRISRVPPYLIRPITLPIRGCHPLWLCFPAHSGHDLGSAGPRSLATTRGVAIAVLSSGYLDVSVPRVCSYKPMYSVYKYLVLHPDSRATHDNRPSAGPKDRCTCIEQARSGYRCAITEYNQVGCPIQKSMDQSLFSAPHGLSQSITSFIASYCLGIHQTPFSRLI